MAFSFDIKGLDKVQKALQEKPAEAKKAIHTVLKDHVTEINEQQKRNAQGFQDRGSLWAGINFLPVDEINFVLFSQAPYSAFIEFGTRKKFRAIPEVDASQYKGSGGGGGQGLYNAILAWVKRKGIAYGTTFSVKTRRKKGGKAQDRAEKQAAYAIYKSILVNGINPHPFFFQPFLSRKEQIKRDVEKAINNLK